MNYKTIDLNTWDRGALFKFYIDKMRIVMSLTAVSYTHLDVYKRQL